VPKILYKYRYFDENGYHLSLIEKGELWFTSAREFNDPFDSILDFQFSDDPPGIMNKWANDFVKREFPDKPRAERRRIVKERLKEIRNSHDHEEWFHKHNIKMTYNKFGICALTSKSDNLLMWAHYAKNHTGFCVGLDRDVIICAQHKLAEAHKILLDMVKINYHKKMPKLNFFNSMLSNRGKDDIITLLSTKSDHWSYEDEYRLTLWEKINHGQIFPKDTFRTIYLGCKISYKNRERILQILDDKEMDTEVFQASISRDCFKLIFDKIR